MVNVLLALASQLTEANQEAQWNAGMYEEIFETQKKPFNSRLGK
jgi:hypothetical protein